MFKSKQQKEIEKKMLIKRTINTMNKQINALEEQKNVFIEKAKDAKKKGLDSQYSFALTGYKMTLLQQKRAQEMLLNFEITSQMKDMTSMTHEFLNGMSSLSKEMSQLAGEKEFMQVQKEFEKAMLATERQAAQLDVFLDSNKDAFASAGGTHTIKDSEFEKLIDQQNSLEESAADTSIDSELEALQKKIASELNS